MAGSCPDCLEGVTTTVDMYGETINHHICDHITDTEDNELIFAARELVRTRGLLRELQQTESLLVRQVATLMPQWQHTIEGVGTLKKHQAKDSERWDIDRLLPIIAARTADEAVDRETGELIPIGALAELVGRRIRECFGVYRGKVTGVRALGLNPDDYRTFERGMWKVEIV